MLKAGQIWLVQQGNDPKKSCKSTKEWLKKTSWCFCMELYLWHNVCTSKNFIWANHFISGTQLHSNPSSNIVHASCFARAGTILRSGGCSVQKPCWTNTYALAKLTFDCLEAEPNGWRVLMWLVTMMHTSAYLFNWITLWQRHCFKLYLFTI